MSKTINKRKLTAYITVAVLIVGAIVALILTNQSKNEKDNPALLNTTMDVKKIKSGNITNSISGRGTAFIAQTGSVKSEIECEIEEFFVGEGSLVNEGTPLYKYDADSLKSIQEDLNQKLDEKIREGYAASGKKESLEVKAEENGRIKLLEAKKDEKTADILEENEQIALISTGGRMYLDVETTELKADDEVKVKIGESETDGRVISEDGSHARVEILSDAYGIGATATVYNKKGGKIGKGSLKLSEYVPVEAPEGRISHVHVRENQKVTFGDKLFTVKADNSEYKKILDEIGELEKEISLIQSYIESPTVISPYSGIVASISVYPGNPAQKGAEVVKVNLMEKLEVIVSVEEKDINKVTVGQEATLICEDRAKIQGVVTHINYNASDDNGTNMFDVHIQATDMETVKSKNILPGMSLDAAVTLESRDNVLKAPIDGIYNDGEGYYVMVYHGDKDIKLYEKNEVPKEKRYVEVGISNSRYTEIISGLEEDEEIVVIKASNSSMFAEPEISVAGSIFSDGD